MTAVWPSVHEIAESVKNGEYSATDMVKKAHKLIDEKKEFNTVITVIHDRALLRAKEIDDHVTKGEKVGRLAGVPFIAKDNFLTFGSETTAASNILKGFEAPYQATAIELLEAEGAICVAKANLDAFAHGTSTENSDFMITKNPHDISRVPGGSSGGSAAAVVLELTPFALGTDTGGSIRQPASLSGCVGYKPTYGLVSRSGVVAMASSTDVIGPLARNVEDVALVLDVMARQDKLDSTSILPDTTGYHLNEDIFELQGTKIGVIKEYFGEGLTDDVRETVMVAINKLKSAGAVVTEISLPSSALALACYYIIVPAEISSNLSRYDGQRYGYSSAEAGNLEESYYWSRSEGFGREAKRRIMIGAYVLSSGYYDAYYRKAQQLRTKLIEEFNNAFQGVDYMVGPVAPTTAFEIGVNISNPLQMYLQDIYSVVANLVGIPAISLPAGKAKGLPVGLQIMAPMRADKNLLKLSKSIEGVIA